MQCIAILLLCVCAFLPLDILTRVIFDNDGFISLFAEIQLQPNREKQDVQRNVKEATQLYGLRFIYRKSFFVKQNRLFEFTQKFLGIVSFIYLNF